MAEELSRHLLFLISADRDFPDPIIDKVRRIEQNGLFWNTGNYSSARSCSAAENGQQQAQYESQQLRRAHLQKLCRSFPRPGHQSQNRHQSRLEECWNAWD